MENYKEDIVQSRVGHLGSSDAKLLQQIADAGFVPQSAKKRLAVCKGLIPHEDIPKTAAILAGDAIEMAIYENLKATDARWESNPCWISNWYKRDSFSLLTHPDFVRQDDEHKVLTVVEAKTTKFSFEKTRQTYAAQLFIHYLLAEEKAKALGKGWRVELKLAVYDTKGLELENGVEFDPARLTVKPVRINPKVPMFDVEKALNVIDEFMQTFDEFYEMEDVEVKYLPEQVRNQFSEVANFLREIKEREAKVDEFKKKIYDFLYGKGIKKVACDDFAFTVVAPSQQSSFDHKKYLEDYGQAHPKLVKKVREKYTKITQKKGYVKISVSDNKE